MTICTTSQVVQLHDLRCRTDVQTEMLKEILQSKSFTVIVLVIIGFFLISTIKLGPPIMIVRKELKNLDQKINEAEKTSLELKELSDYLKSNDYLERQARLKLNYKKPDERVVYVYRKNTETTPFHQTGLEVGRAQEIFENKFVTNLKQWWKYLINR
ncbi:MAG: septum formation initiator family protein [Candidatus Yanofskybacteria bacterium]|nr:septum formation initiator family protein [Candidatus Yanofskybacteria bacterium]